MIVIGGLLCGTSTPRASASRMMARAVRSLTLPPGLRCSHLINTGLGSPAQTFFSSISGVLPIASMTSIGPTIASCVGFTLLLARVRAYLSRMRGLVMVAALLAVSPAYADPAQPKAKPARRAWKAKRAEPVKPPASPVVITPAVFNAAPTTDVRKFAATIESKPSPGLIYHAAQVYRMNGERAKAIELYQKY